MMAGAACIGLTFDSPSGYPQWEVPCVGTPAPGRCMQLGYTGGVQETVVS
jgi:hypothetical protein